MTQEELNMLEVNARMTAFHSEDSWSPEIQSRSNYLSGIFNDKYRVKEVLYNLILLIEIMKNDIACFHFRKQDGTIREAYGTRQASIIDHYLTLSGKRNLTNKEKNASPSTLSYFDLEKLEWRCFRIGNLKLVDTNYKI